jgi:hypothetical protein
MRAVSWVAGLSYYGVPQWLEDSFQHCATNFRDEDHDDIFPYRPCWLPRLAMLSPLAVHAQDGALPRLRR